MLRLPNLMAAERRLKHLQGLLAPNVIINLHTGSNNGE